MSLNKSTRAVIEKYDYKNIESASLSYKNGIVSLETDSLYSAIEIHYKGRFEGFSELGTDYFIFTGKSKIIILKINKNSPYIKSRNIFKYYGEFFPTSCRVIQNRYSEIYAEIDRENATFNKSDVWNTLFTKWESLTDPSLYTYVDSYNEKGSMGNYYSTTMQNEVDPNFFKLIDSDGKRHYGQIISKSINGKIQYYKNNEIRVENILKGEVDGK